MSSSPDDGKSIAPSEGDRPLLNEMLDHELKRFQELKVMRPGFEEKKQGNPKLQAAREQAAPLFAKGTNLSDAEKKLLSTLYDEMYYRDALTKLLEHHHPSTSIARLNKQETISKIIQAQIGFPAIYQWVEIFDKTAPPAQEHDDDDKDDDQDEDLSKARRHDRNRTTTVIPGNTNPRARSMSKSPSRNRRRPSRSRSPKFKRPRPSQPAHRRNHDQRPRIGSLRRREERQARHSRQVGLREGRGGRPAPGSHELRGRSSRHSISTARGDYPSTAASRSPSRRGDSSQLVTKADLSQLLKTELAEAVAKASREGYMRGRAEAEDAGAEKWLPQVDSKLVAKAKALEYIALADIKKAKALQSKAKQSPKEFKLNQSTKIVVQDDEAEQDNSTIRWVEWQSLFVDLLDLYFVHGGHIEKASEMLNHLRLCLTFGNGQIFTYESIIDYDQHIRSRKEGQGENLSWRFDSTTRCVILKDFILKDKKTASKAKPSRLQNSKKRKTADEPGICFDWFSGGACKFKEACKFIHMCAACGLLKPAAHDLGKCSNTDSAVVKLKSRKAKKNE